MLIDAHVHIHPGFDRAVFLQSAADNLARAGAARGHPPAPGGLILTEIPGADVFDAFAAGRGLPRGWRAQAPSQDPEALWLQGPEGRELLLVSGRQFVSAEGLEILAVGGRPEGLGGQPAAEILARLGGMGLPAVLPWGAGKWIGERGRVLRALLDAAARPGVLLGDNAGRPFGWPKPGCFRGGPPVLPGTDPLPIAAAAQDAGRYGVVCDQPLPRARPAAALRDWLLRLTVQPPVFGRRCGPVAFAHRQVMLRAG
ncbi:hypothetical protein [Limimaricola hongkongensis]|uniref:Amidohydrolase-related domain-containing protein n=1 Tax=Limimaricola hongkongensis DSM 17492 TaxID=1122180 RepID=A0A017H7K9_9RHOB|nr:hypothetical protein [Limimaricola hongkongensis]EYD70366.1 hypothetical protein Lokhon_00120 [Limimaricola hongkongensis DSM 17492]